MTILAIEVDGQNRNLYVDNELYNRINLTIKPKLKKKDFDWVWVVDGSEGSGKSVFSFQLAKVVDPSFCLERVCMTPNEFTRAVIKAEKGQAVVFDEGFTGLSSRASLTEINRLMVSLMMEMRQKNLFIVVVMPTIFLLDRYVALFRAKGLFHVYMKGGNRGRWIYFNNKSKKQLYIYGKKLFSYSRPKSNFRGRFADQYTVNEEEYRKKKAEALSHKSRSTRAETFKMQRDILFYIMNRKLNMNQEQISRYCKDLGYKVEQNTISEAITTITIQLVKEENT
jgi:hypothetical protein